MSSFGMPDLVETQMYCSQQINIPPNLPSILKRYAKAAIRTQPYDLLVWSAAYFKAVADGVTPPAKLRIEYPPNQTPSGLSPGYLRVLINQLGKEGKVPKKVIREKWSGVCLARDALTSIFRLGHFVGKEVDWLKFIAIAAGMLEPNVTRTMILICELLTEEPEGGSSIVPVGTFMSLYRFLAKIDAGPDDPNPRPSPPPSEPLPSDTGIQFEMASEASEHALDSVLRAVTKESKLSVDTKAMSEVQSLTGVMVWPSDSNEEEVTPPLPEAKPSEEGATSLYGVQVWEKPAAAEVESKVEHLPEGSVIEEKPVDEHLEKKEKEAGPKLESDAGEPEEIEGEEGEGEGGGELEADRLKLLAGLDIIKSYEDTEEEDDSAFVEFTERINRLDSVRGVEDEEEEAGTARLPGDDLAFIDDMHQSAEDLKQETESEEISSESKDEMASVVSFGGEALSADVSGPSLDGGSVIRRLTAPSITSVGQPISPKMTLDELPVVLNEDVEEPSPPDTDEESMGEEPFWMPVPGIGPIIAPEVIEAVADYMTCWADRQCGMVMPRNIRHFLCPPLEEL